MIIVLSGGKQHGKDTFAKTIMEGFPELKFKRRAFADAMKDMTKDLLGCTLEELEYLKTEEDTVCTNPYAIAGGATMREFLQTLGQSIKDLTDDKLIWCRIMESTMNFDHNYIVTDCRFAFEADYLKAVFGSKATTVQVYNPRVPLGEDKHISEQSYDDIHFDGVVLNDGTIEDLEEQAISLVDTLQKGNKYV